MNTRRARARRGRSNHAWVKDEETKFKKPELLAEFFNAMGKIGFINVDCYYKYGIFTMFGGKK